MVIENINLNYIRKDKTFKVIKRVSLLLKILMKFVLYIKNFKMDGISA